jgi:hypothetical protein
MFTQEERQAIYDFLKEIHGYSPAYIRVRVMEFVRAMGVLRNTNSENIIEFSKWLNNKFCREETYPDVIDWEVLEETIFSVLK